MVGPLRQLRTPQRGDLPDLGGFSAAHRSRPFNNAISCKFNANTRLQPLESNLVPLTKPTRLQRRLPATKLPPQRRASWSEGTYARDPLLASSCSAEGAVVAENICARGK